MDVACADAAVPPSSSRLRLVAALVALATAALLLATSFGLPMVWDEGDAIVRSEGVERWVRRWGEEAVPGATGGPLSQEAIAEDWQYTTQREGHPALYGVVIAAGRAISMGWLPPLEQARLGPILLFAVAAGAMFYRLAREYSVVAAVGAVAALLLMPRMFAHAHFASFDGPLVSCWILAWATFAPAVRDGRWALLWGLTLGMTLSVKATGWFAPLPFFLWAVVYRDRGARRAILVGLPAALLVFLVLNPPLWHQPMQGLFDFFALNTHRAAQGLNISTQFLGHRYNLDHPLPWYNTLFWTAITVPIGILGLSGLGLWRVLRHPSDRPGMLLAANWLVLLVVRAIPGTPPHDGVRLFLPSFAFLAALAGVGAGWMIYRARNHKGDGARRKPWIAISTCGVLLLAYLGSATSLVWYAPQWLSYYNLLVGGLPGAVAVGMEPTYYWDGLDRSMLDWLAEHTGPDEKVQFAAGPATNLALMSQWGRWRGEHRQEAPGRFRWYVLQHRPGAWQPADRWLVEHQPPAYGKRLREAGWRPWRLTVPLVEVYSYEQYRWACQAAPRR